MESGREPEGLRKDSGNFRGGSSALASWLPTLPLLRFGKLVPTHRMLISEPQANDTILHVYLSAASIPAQASCPIWI